MGAWGGPHTADAPWVGRPDPREYYSPAVRPPYCLSAAALLLCPLSAAESSAPAERRQERKREDRDTA